MKRKDSYSATEESFDSLMAHAVESDDVKKVNYQGCSSLVCSPDKKAVGDAEVDKDSDYEGSETDIKQDVTTLRMLFDRTQCSDVEFHDVCFEVGLFHSSVETCLECSSDEHTHLLVSPTTFDGVLRRCDKCDVEWSARRDSWIGDFDDSSLKEIVLVVYTWCQNYSKHLASHELQIHCDKIDKIYNKCSTVPNSYFKNSISNLGGTNKTIMADIFVYNDRSILGLLDRETKNSYFSILKDFDESSIVTILIDSLSKGSSIVTSPDSQLCQSLTDLANCTAYMRETWGIFFETRDISNSPLVLEWMKFDRSLPPVNCMDSDYSEDECSVVRSVLFRNRMENSKDCFLFFLEVVNQLFNSS